LRAAAFKLWGNSRQELKRSPVLVSGLERHRTQQERRQMRIVGFLQVRTGSRPARACVVDARDLRGRAVLTWRAIVPLRRPAFTLLRGRTIRTRRGFVPL
jgi:hypothetical protein